MKSQRDTEFKDCKMNKLEKQVEKGLELLEAAIIQERVTKLKPQLAKMREAYAGLERVDPCGATYKKLSSKIAQMSIHDLQVMYAARIKWLSYEAGKELKRIGLMTGAISLEYRKD